MRVQGSGPFRRTLLAAALAAAAGASQAQVCNYLGALTGQIVDHIGPGEVVVDGGTVDGTLDQWCNYFPFTVQAGATLINGRALPPYGNGTVQFDNGVIVNGLLSNTTLTNLGTIANGSYGVFRNNALLTNAGLLLNDGTMNVTWLGGVLANAAAGSFLNTGSLTIEARFGGPVGLVNDGQISNLGSIVVAGTAQANAGSTWSNAGLVRNTASGFLDIGIDAGFSNAGPAAQLVNDGGVVRVAGVLDNAASLLNTGASSSFQVLAGGQVNHPEGGSFTNEGSVVVLGTMNFSASGVQLRNRGHLTVLDGGVVSASFAVADPQDVFTPRAQIVNEAGGTISMFGGLIISQLLSNDGEISVGGTLVLANDPPGVEVSVNNGTITSFNSIQLVGTELVNGPTGVLRLNEGTLAFYGGSLRNLAGGQLIVAPGASIVSIGSLGGGVTNEGYWQQDGTLSSRSVVNRGTWAIGSTAVVEVAIGGVWLGPDSRVTVAPGAVVRIGGIWNTGGTWINGGNVTVLAGTAVLADQPGTYTQVSGRTRVDGNMTWQQIAINGGELCGTGIVRAKTTGTIAHATVCPGNSPGTLTLQGDFSFEDATLRMELAGSAAGLYDVLRVEGQARFAQGRLVLVFLDGYVPGLGQQWRLLDLPGGATGLDTLAVSYEGLDAGYGFSVVLADGGLEVVASSVPASVPEPPAAALLALGLVGLALRRRRKH